MLAVSPGTVAALKAIAEQGYPHEVCGLLLGRFEDDRRLRRVREVRQAANLDTARAADRYDLDPGDFLRLEKEAAERGLAVVGIFHSHPDHPSAPSETDRARAAEVWGPAESWSYVILEVAGGRVVSWRSWVLRGGAFEEEPVEEGRRAV